MRDNISIVKLFELNLKKQDVLIKIANKRCEINELEKELFDAELEIQFYLVGYDNKKKSEIFTI